MTSGTCSPLRDDFGQVGGLIAQVGSRLVEAVAKKMLDEFFRELGSSSAASPLLAEKRTAHRGKNYRYSVWMPAERSGSSSMCVAPDVQFAGMKPICDYLRT
jgi:hypothetical protein